MKIAISSVGNNLESEIDSRFGRCNYFLIVEADEKNKKIKSFRAIKNTAKEQMGGAGITSAQIVANEKPNAVITVNTGPKAFQVLSQLKIPVYSGSGKIDSAIKDFLNGKLKKAKDATGVMHLKE
jgi:predicted Fe-Mo cluster-binding NifX family protein